jgi:hypothetical protein
MQNAAGKLWRAHSGRSSRSLAAVKLEITGSHVVVGELAKRLRAVKEFGEARDARAVHSLSSTHELQV